MVPTGYLVPSPSLGSRRMSGKESARVGREARRFRWGGDQAHVSPSISVPIFAKVVTPSSEAVTSRTTPTALIVVLSSVTKWSAQRQD